jgi:hypothetical protein
LNIQFSLALLQFRFSLLEPCFSFLPISTSSSSLIGLPSEPLPDEEDEDKEDEELSLDDSSEGRNHFLRSGRSLLHSHAVAKLGKKVLGRPI